jgi:hypothetical protein
LPDDVYERIAVKIQQLAEDPLWERVECLISPDQAVVPAASPRGATDKEI